MRVIPDNTSVNIPIFCAKDTGTDIVRYFGEFHLATLIEIIITDNIVAYRKRISLG